MPDQRPHGDNAEAREIAAALRDAIHSGEFNAGDKLPSERVLAATYHGARNTARAAIQELIQEGLVRPEHGRGYFVRERPRWMRFGRLRYTTPMRAVTRHGPFGAEARAQGKTPRVEVRSAERIPADPDVAERLGIEPGTDVVRRENWYYADEIPDAGRHHVHPVVDRQGHSPREGREPRQAQPVRATRRPRIHHREHPRRDHSPAGHPRGSRRAWTCPPACP